MSAALLTSRFKILLSMGLATLSFSSLALEYITVQPEQVAEYFDLEATLEAVNESTVSAQTSGAVEAILVDVNDSVEANSVIVRINNTQQQAALQQALANLEQAKAQNEDAQVVLTRNKRLYDKQSLSKGEYDSAVARAKSAAAAVKAAEAGLQQAKEQLSYTEVKAPFSGIVKARHIELGELVSPGQPLMTGLALSPLRAVADLPQAVATGFKKTGELSLIINDEQLLPEKVTLFPYADSRHHSIRLRAQLPETQAEAYPGQWLKLRVKTGERESILVPQSAILQRGELSSVYVLVNDTARLRQVRTGEDQNGQTEILSGLQAGDIIVTDALAQLAALRNNQ